MPCTNTTGKNTHTVVSVEAINAPEICLTALHASAQDGHALLVVQAVDVLDGDDGVVHQHADAQRQAGKGEHG